MSTRAIAAAAELRTGLACRGARGRAFVTLTRPGVSLLVVLTAPPAVLLGGSGRSPGHALLAAMAATLFLSAGCDRRAFAASLLSLMLVFGAMPAGLALRWGTP